MQQTKNEKGYAREPLTILKKLITLEAETSVQTERKVAYMTKEFTYVKELTERVSLVKHKKTGRIGRVIWTSMEGNTNFFTVHYLNGSKKKKYEGRCRPQDFYLVNLPVKGTMPRGSA